MKLTQTTATGIINIFCPKCEKKQLAIYPGSSYQLTNPAQIPMCKKCSSTLGKNVNNSLLAKANLATKKKQKQNNRKKYKARYGKVRTLKS